MINGSTEAPDEYKHSDHGHSQCLLWTQIIMHKH